MLDLNLARAKELIEAAIEERGADYVYPYTTCEYALLPAIGYACTKGPRKGERETFAEPTVGCGVGLALFKGGITLETLLGETGGTYDILRNLKNKGQLRSTDAAQALLQGFQSRQDDAFAWGDAYAGAIEDVTGGVDRWGDFVGTDDEEWIG
jgi:hypothetical protein